MAYTMDFDISLGSSKTGLTLAAQIIDTSGVDVGSEITTGFTEIGDGCYLWHYASIPDDHRGGVKIYEDGVPGTILAFAAINPEEAENIDVASSTLATASALSTHDGKLDTVDANVDAILVDTDTTIPALIAALNDMSAAEVWAYASRLLTGGTSSINVVSAVSGSTITAYANDTWSFTVTDTDLDLDDYEVLEFGVKSSDTKTDDEAILLLRKDTGLVRIDGAAPSDASNGTLTNTTTSFTILVAIAETQIATYGTLLWYLKGFDTTPTPNTGTTLAKGVYIVNRPGVRAVA